MKPAELLTWLASAPPGTTLTAEAVRTILAEELESTRLAESPQIDPEPFTWRERLWTVPPDTRIGVPELAEALGRSKDWVYRAVSKKLAEERGREPLPRRKLDGELHLVVGEVREWIRRNEEVLVRGPEEKQAALRAM